MAEIPSAVLEAALVSDEKEKQYTTTKHAIEILARNEIERRLQIRISTVSDGQDELRKELHRAQDGTERLRALVSEHLARAQSAEAMLEELQRETRCREHELFRLTSENQSLRDASNNTSAMLTQKLALDRELSVLRPEVEHLRTQNSSVEQLIKDKLALQRQLSDAKCEIEAAKIEVAGLKKRKNSSETATEVELEKTKKLLAREKRARENAEEAAASARSDVDGEDVQRELAKERRRREEVEEELITAKEDSSRVQELRRQLAKEKKSRQQVEDELDSLQAELDRERDASRQVNKQEPSGVDETIATLRKQLHAAKQAQIASKTTATKQEGQLEAEKTQLEEERDKLKTMLADAKKSLSKSTRTQSITSERLATLGVAIAANIAASPMSQIKDVKKRTSVGEVHHFVIPTLNEMTLGTPGDGPTTKKNRKAAAAVGDKSTFSITPFLNKTSVVNLDDDVEPAVFERSPSVLRSAINLPSALAPSVKKAASISKAMMRKGREEDESGLQVDGEQSRQDMQELDVVAEPVQTSAMLAEYNEDDTEQHVPPSQHVEAQEPAVEAGQQQSDKENQVVLAISSAATEKKKPTIRVKQKSRKSLTDFKSFQVDDEKPVVKQKKRKLGGRGATIFDDDEDADRDGMKPNSRGGLCGASAYARLASAKKISSMAKTPSMSRGGFSSTIDGTISQFSPLKRHRKNLDDTLRG